MGENSFSLFLVAAFKFILVFIFSSSSFIDINRKSLCFAAIFWYCVLRNFENTRHTLTYSLALSLSLFYSLTRSLFLSLTFPLIHLPAHSLGRLILINRQRQTIMMLREKKSRLYLYKRIKSMERDINHTVAYI